MGRKRKSIYKGFLSAQDVRKMDMSDKTLKNYWSRVKNNLFILGDEENVIFLNREFKKLARKFEGKYVKITIEEEDYEPPEERGLPDMDTEYDGFEKFKRTMFSVFGIS